MSENIENAVTETAEQNSNKGTNFFSKLGGGVREWFRKLVVGLKRRPHNIGLLVYVVALLVYTLNQTLISNTTATVNRNPMGLCSFVAILFSILGFVCLFNSFPKRQKPKWVMIGLLFAMMAAVIACDIVYYVKLSEGIAQRLSECTTPQQISEFYKKFSYYETVQNILIVHIVLIVISCVLTGLSPLIGKLLRKIRTSISVDDNGEMAEIERENDEE